MIVGYARTSTHEQNFGLSAQIELLEKEGCDRIFSEQTSSRGQRTEFEATLSFVRDGDVLIITKLDRLARSVSDLWKIVEKLDEKNVSLRILNLSLDTGTATGKLMLSMLAAVAEFERDIMLERQRDGIAKAKAAGVRFGRKSTIKRKRNEVMKLASDDIGASEIARKVGISRASVYRILHS